MDLGLGFSASEPETRVLKNVSNFFRDSPVIVPPRVHTKENRNKHCSHTVICSRGGNTHKPSTAHRMCTTYRIYVCSNTLGEVAVFCACTQ